jgi:hypothetical protein
MSNDTVVVSAVTAKWAKGTGGPSGDEAQNLVMDSGDVAATLRESDGHHGRSSPRGDGCDNLVAYQGQGSNVGPMGTLRAGNGNATGGVPFVADPAYCIEDPGRKMSGGPEVGIGVQEEVAYTLQAGARHAVAQSCEVQEPMAVGENGRNELRLMPHTTALAAGGGKPGQGYQAVLLPPEPLIIEGDSAASTPDLPGLRAGCGRGGEVAVLIPSDGDVAPALRTNPYNNSDPGMEARMLVQAEPDAFYPHSGLNQAVQRGVSPPLTVGAGRNGGAKAPAVTAFSSKDDGRDATEDLSPTLRRGGHKDSHANAGVPPAIASSNADGAPRVGMVRRLTPVECARLQGFPDNWLCLCGAEPFSTATCKCADGAKYRALGNAVAVPVVFWIARRLAMLPTEVPS